jgi:cytochrome b subunit of formate dehydrogenase
MVTSTFGMLSVLSGITLEISKDQLVIQDQQVQQVRQAQLVHKVSLVILQLLQIPLHQLQMLVMHGLTATMEKLMFISTDTGLRQAQLQ